MTIDQISYFLAIQEYKSFSTAAEELCISLSSLSKHIKSLESELDTKLFERSSRTIKLTKAGEAFVPCAQRFLSTYQDILLQMKEYSFVKEKIINIGSIAVLTQYGLTSCIAAFKENYPDISINITEEEHDAVLTLLDKKEIDLAITRDTHLPAS